jgi:hypothetical protein
MRLSPLFALTLSLVAVPFVSGQAPATELPTDQAAIFDRMRAAYYHPGKIGIACDATVDFSGVLTKLGGASSAETAKAVDGLKLRISSVADGATDVVFLWPAKFPADARPMLEANAKQMVSGFFDNYWPLVNAEMVPSAKEQTTIVGAMGGGYLVTAREGSLRLTVDTDGLVRRMYSHSPSGRDTALALSYKATDVPQPGDSRRFSGMDVDQSAGANHVKVVMSWDDQDVAGVHIPHHLTVALPGAFEIPITLMGCTVTPPASK